MGTPLKSARLLKNPGLLSPLATFLSTSPRASDGSDNVLKGNNFSPARNENVAKCLPFSQKFLLPSKDLSPNCYKRYVSTNEYQESHSELLLNTPNKQSLLKHGICRRKLYNILGTGSFGTVVKGVYKDQTVAIKVEKLQCRDVSEFPELNGLGLNHENIMKTIDVILNKEEDYGLVVMEYHPNSCNLQIYLEKQSCDKLFVFALDIAKGLDYLHEKDIVHLDIKPRNIMVCNDVCKICDFGNSIHVSRISKEFNYQAGHSHPGTVAYMDPEIFLGRPPSKKSDIYSLGILLWQLRSRTPPYEDLDNDELIIYKVVKFHHRPDMGSDCLSSECNSDSFANIYRLCWRSDPRERPDTKHIRVMLKNASESGSNL